MPPDEMNRMDAVRFRCQGLGNCSVARFDN
jgi:hypothetical protein